MSHNYINVGLLHFAKCGLSWFVPFFNYFGKVLELEKIVRAHQSKCNTSLDYPDGNQ